VEATSAFGPGTSRPVGAAEDVWVAKQISTLFDSPVIVEAGHVDRTSGSLFPEEAACVARAVDSRRREFTCGRLCARRALGRLAVDSFPLVVGPDRAPLWPPEVVGSLTHTAGLCSVVVARRGPVEGLGLDIEQASALDVDLVGEICSAGELACLSGAPAPPSTDWPKVLFSIKEAVFKCVYPVVGRYFGFHEVEIQVTDDQRFEVRSRIPELPPHIKPRGRFVVEGGLIFAGCWR